MSDSQPKQNRVENAADYIRSRIVSGEFPPGSHITETNLATALGTSRGPVREALKTLESEGMVTHTPNKGYSVIFLSPQDAWEVFYLRGHLEKMALELAGGKIPIQGLIKIENALEKMEAAQREGRIDEIVEWDEMFHKTVVESGNLDRLTNMWTSLSPMNLAMFYSGLRASVFDFTNQWEKHVTLFQILSKGELKASVEAVLGHYLNTGKNIYKNSL